jgi:ABC-type uncharacterized transport system substrate-binding protein
MSRLRLLGLAGATLALATGSSMPAAAHPHVWVKVETKVVYDKGAVTAFSHRWTFDDLYTAMAIQGLDANNDGTYDRKELAELAQVNMDGLKEFDYFTFAKLGPGDLKLAEPKEYWLEVNDGVLTLNFVLPLATPVLAEAEGFTFAVTDPSYFIAFDLAEKSPVTLGEGAPQGCVAEIGANGDKASDDAARLGQAFSNQLGGAYPMAIAKSVAIVCPKS